MVVAHLGLVVRVRVRVRVGVRFRVKVRIRVRVRVRVRVDRVAVAHQYHHARHGRAAAEDLHLLVELMVLNRAQAHLIGGRVWVRVRVRVRVRACGG